MCTNFVPTVIAVQSATVVDEQTCTLGRTDLQPSARFNPTPGWFIQEEGAAPCDGLATQWRVCYYYRPLNSSGRSNFIIALSVWHEEEPTISFSLVEYNIRRITVADQQEGFQCTDIAVAPNEGPMKVRKGDHLGVFIPSRDFTVVSADPVGRGSVYFFQSGTSTKLNLSSGIESNLQILAKHAIHVSATIVGEYMVTTVIEVFEKVILCLSQLIDQKNNTR